MRKAMGLMVIVMVASLVLVSSRAAADPVSDGVAQAAVTGKLVMVDFWADWCHWCKRMDVTLADQQVAGLVRDKFVYVKLDVGKFDRHTDRLKEFSVRGIPTVVILDGSGQLVAKHAGYLPPKDFVAWLNKSLAEAPRQADMAAGDGGAAGVSRGRGNAEAQPQVEGSTVVVNAEYVARYLRRMGLKFETNAAKGYCHMVLRGRQGAYDTYVITEPKRSLAFIVVRDYLTVRPNSRNCDRALRALMDANWNLSVGKFEWSKTTGEVRITYAFGTQNGIGYDTFKAIFQRIAQAADEQLPMLKRANGE